MFSSRFSFIFTCDSRCNIVCCNVVVLNLVSFKNPTSVVDRRLHFLHPLQFSNILLVALLYALSASCICLFTGRLVLFDPEHSRSCPWRSRCNDAIAESCSAFVLASAPHLAPRRMWFSTSRATACGFHTSCALYSKSR
ncbi:uncharacterized protein K489DRAFT_127949 [Dissoconium aciculare CBS 342.82]|uniref:Uncharacterized protein n=1 Tax=Dissoconium aciculare CBS 342.82 TaxID=1314786 RepID=A0A6J3LSI0_9PEZI|nr:uncharacterized protein K489DRAFT_127949 [Dissoconium aciculare CBS 342.82]KAF1818249.1 hypothetical protein K489DRAFT_127949 [Dissoconium aciculare CBS 342.82]